MKLDDVKKLQQKKYRNQLGYYLVEGEHLILELQKVALKHSYSLGTAQPGATQLSAMHLSTTQLYVTEDYQDWPTPFTKQVISKKHMAQLSDTKTPQGIVACVPMPDLKNTNPEIHEDERCIYLHEVQDPGNLGTILRTLAWFGNFRLLLSPNSVDPFNPKVVRSSMGALFHVPMELDVTLEDLKTRFDHFAYLDMNGEAIQQPSFNEYNCYLFGNEARGVPREALQALNAQAYTIAGSGAIESLNLAMAVNISAYQLSGISGSTNRANCSKDSCHPR